MFTHNYKYLEIYKRFEIYIVGHTGEWYWIIMHNSKSKNSPTYYFSLLSAINDARKYIDKRSLYFVTS